MKFLRTVAEVIFILVQPLVRPAAVQLFLRKYIALPYSMTQHLNYKGVVPFTVGKKKLFMQSYNTPIEMTVFWRGIFAGREGAELSIWSKLSRGAKVALDIGANNGIYALVSSAEPTLLIHAFEPVPKVYEMLLENINLNKTSNIIPHQMVVSHSDGFETLYVPKEGWVDVASLNQAFAHKYTEGRKLVEERCVAVTIDTFLAEQTISQSEMVICKIDVEGAEPLVLAGAKRVIAEYNMAFLIEALDAPAFDAIKPFFGADYQVYGVDIHSRKLFKTTEADPYRANNYLYLKSIPTWLLEEIAL